MMDLIDEEFFEERSAIREYDAGFTREEATRLGMLDSRQWMLACLVRQVAGMEPFERRRSFVDDFRKHHGDAAAETFIEALKKARGIE